MRKIYIVGFMFIILFTGCSVKQQAVRQQDLDAWVNVPVEELDIHSFFLTLPIVKTKTESGLEIRNYPNKINIGSCYGFANGGFLNKYQYGLYQTCSSDLVGCDNIFYIKDKKVLEYKPVGSCYTDEIVQPEKRNWNK